MSIKYRPEIDGLRTLAVLAVIIYHAEFFFRKHHVLQGGFFGVDIFFVISGFLITSLIVKEIYSTGKFSFLNFYNRRAKRLLPVLIVVYTVSFPFAWYMLLPESFVDFSKSIIASNLFISNFYWYDSLQVYGTEASNLKPFLHTWSLAVEEQYYMIFPILLLVIMKWFKKYMVSIFILLIVLSLVFAELMSGEDAYFSFYLLLSRFWELLIGGILAYFLYKYPNYTPRNMWSKMIPTLGLFLIVYAFVFVDYESYNHPGLITLLPVIGAVLIIWFSDKDEWITKILSSKIFVGIGIISYSLYLWHFPIFAFLRIENYFTQLEYKLIAIVLVMMVSMFTYKFIEQPFRSKFSLKWVYLFILVSTLAIITVNYLVIKNEGYPDRYKGSVALGYKEMMEYRKKYWSNMSIYTRSNNFSKDNFSVQVIGNSWAQDIANSLLENSNYEVGYHSTDFRCSAITLNPLPKEHKHFKKLEKLCKVKNLEIFNRKLINTNLVIIADNHWMQRIYDNNITNEVLKNIDLLRTQKYEGPILIISNRPTYKKSIFKILKEYGSVGDGVNHYAKQYMAFSLHSLRKEDRIAKEFYNKNEVYYYSLVEAFCSTRECKIVNEGMPLYHDGSHLTMSGAQYIGKYLLEFIISKKLSDTSISKL